MKTLHKITLALCLCVSINSFAANVINPAQIDTTPPAADGALIPSSIQPIVLSQANTAATQVNPAQPGAATAPQQTTTTTPTK